MNCKSELISFLMWDVICSRSGTRQWAGYRVNNK